MKIDKFETLKFRKVEAEFDDKRTLYASMITGKFTRQDILNKMEELAKKLRDQGKNGYIGVTAHYEFPNAWLPALYCCVDKKQKLFDASYSTSTIEYKNIDAMYFFVAEMPDGQILKQKMHKVKKANQSTEGMFTKK